MNQLLPPSDEHVINLKVRVIGIHGHDIWMMNEVNLGIDYGQSYPTGLFANRS